MSTAEEETPKPMKKDENPLAEPPRRRFFLRALSAVVAPPVLASYFIWTYHQFLRDGKPRRDANTFTPDGRYIWWSWFVIGALGLNVSNYVLAGIEAGMLASPRFQGLDFHQICMHKDRSWSRISGWVVEARSLLSQQNRRISRAWVPLFVLSVLSWAFVLTGLTMATRETVKRGSQPSTVNALGNNQRSFNLRLSYGVLDDAFRSWRRGSTPRLPGLGALYFEPGDSVSFNMTTGNTLPPEAPNTVFLAPQADVVVTGRVWGLAVRYSCKSVRKLSELAVLSKRYNSATPGYIGSGSESLNMPLHIVYRVPGTGSATISVLFDRPKHGSKSSVVSLPYMIAEVGLFHGLAGLRDLRRGYSSTAYNGIHDQDGMEFVAWFDQQHMTPELLDDIIPELTGEYREGISGRNMTAVGVRCTSSSTTGIADIDGIAGTFQSLERQDPNQFIWPPGGPNASRWYTVPRLEKAIPAMFLPGLRGEETFGAWEDGTNITAEYDPLTAAFPWIPVSSIDYRYVPTDRTPAQNSSSWDWPTALYASSGVRPESMDQGYGLLYAMEKAPLNSSEIRHALEEAYKCTAVALMYNRGEAAEKLTELVPVEDGAFRVPPVLVISLLISWSVGCMVLALTYSFNERLDSYFSVRSLYWYCKASGLDPTEVMRS
ncbi:hypothetical protein QBC34DRAFT_484144 [Podospora aff. communis PSN243]|uniref:Uncharacterized protein n=1 Tax=Podospora aff. communis PSN243 TaxID=3040156 RepID=A0AAV9GRL5_9PEZI|nr:hypothetical protein QBC34DRAFT_484144 [Podospora aff. communis PSN243]